jgi:hypothetical protein
MSDIAIFRQLLECNMVGVAEVRPGLSGGVVHPRLLSATVLFDSIQLGKTGT